MEGTLSKKIFYQRPPTPGFVGREGILSKIHLAIEKSSKNDGSIILIGGGEGMGKSELGRLLVSNYCMSSSSSHHHQEKNKFQQAIWINFESLESVRRDFESLASHIFNIRPQLIRQEEETSENDDVEIFVGKLAQKIYKYLSEQGLWSFFIFDNFQNSSTFNISQILPIKGGSPLKIRPVILITSRIIIDDDGPSLWGWQKEILKGKKNFCVENLSLDESMRFFSQEFSLKETDNRDDDPVVLKIEKICKNILKGCPLALTLAAGWIKSNQQDYCGDHKTKLRTSLENFLEQFDSSIESTDDDSGGVQLAKIILQNIFNQLEDSSIEALNVIKQLSLFSVDHLKVTFCHRLLTTALPNCDGSKLAKDFDDLLKTLGQVNLIFIDQVEENEEGIMIGSIRIQNSVQKFSKEAQHMDSEFGLELAKPIQKMVLEDPEGQDADLIAHVQSLRRVLEDIGQYPNCHPITRDQCQQFVRTFRKYQTQLPIF